MNEKDEIKALKPAPAATAIQHRLESIDILRGLALFGVLTVNLITEFRVSIFEQFLPQSPDPDQVNRAIIHFVQYVLELKAFALFSFLFGVGLAMQFERLSDTGRPLYWLTRRLFVLLAFGLFHLLLIWNGDILTEYAVAGLVVLPLLYTSRKVLGLAATALLVLYLALPILPVPVNWPDHAWITNHVEQANEVYRVGSWSQIMRFSLHELPSLLPLHVYIFPRTLGLFVLGMLAWRSGILARPAEHKRQILSIGCLLLAIGVVIHLTKENGILSNLAPICQALAFAGIVLCAVEFKPVRAFLCHFTAIGRMAFTNYIAQSLIFGFLFFGYGLGQFGKLTPTSVLAFGIAVYLAQVQLSRFWLCHYRFGPIEWCWRTLMYGRLQPMKR
jgi:uncharacterized protein